MTPKALAEALNGIEYSATIHLHGSDLMKLAKGAGLVVAYGFSDDLLEFDGALCDEFGCYDGGTALIDADGLLPEFESASEDEDACRRYFERKPKARAIESIWEGNADGYSWTLKTDIPHEVFAIVEDGAAFSRGIVFALSDLEQAGQEDT
jgi:hypothetical protein